MKQALAIAGLAAALLTPRPASALETNELLSLVAMPLAVAAVSEVTDIPMNDLMDVVTLLNDAAVPPAQFIEVVRYVPVALVVDDGQSDFVEYVRLREQEGLRGVALVTSIEQKLRTYDLPDVEVDQTPVRTTAYNTTTDFVPVVVRTRLTERASHPHGGPPGQLKKERGLQTGAEVVHDRDRSRAPATTVRVAPRVTDRSDDDRKPAKLRKIEHHEAKQAKAEGHGKPGKGNGKGNGKGHGKGKGR
jgi:hypothetical protein